ncbi:hypothetical protein [Streptomyces microflavus]|uniref:hypothetical protein n=1 Tax=Streptomyces microflavus TaxID=1919 RepID=UPI0036A2845D
MKFRTEFDGITLELDIEDPDRIARLSDERVVELWGEFGLTLRDIIRGKLHQEKGGT